MESDLEIVRRALDTPPQIPAFTGGYLMRAPVWAFEEVTTSCCAQSGFAMTMGEQIMDGFIEPPSYPPHTVSRGFNIATAYRVILLAENNFLYCQRFHCWPFDMGSFGQSGIFVSRNPIAAADAELPLPLLVYHWKSRGQSAESPLLANLDEPDLDWQAVLAGFCTAAGI